jgi:hypothetical protein
VISPPDKLNDDISTEQIHKNGCRFSSHNRTVLVNMRARFSLLQS